MSLDGTITLEDLNQDADHEALYGTDSDNSKAEDATAEEDAGQEPESNADEAKDEGNQEAEAKTEDAKTDDQPEDDNKNKGGIPPERLNQVIGQRNEYKEQLAAQQEENERLRQQLEQQQAQPAKDEGEAEQEAEPSVDEKIKALVKKQKDALMDDDDEAYEQATSEIEALREQKLLDKVAAQNAEKEAAATQKSQETELDQTIDMITQEYPMLDEANAAFDQEFLEVVSDFAYANRAKGIAPAKALEAAVSRAAELKGYTKSSEKEKQDAEKVEDPRKKTALENAIKTNESQPAALDGKGNRATGAIDAKQLSQEDYENLPEKERAQLLQ